MKPLALAIALALIGAGRAPADSTVDPAAAFAWGGNAGV